MTASLRFDYRTPDGSETTRCLNQWVEEGHYVTGFDEGARQVRTFRKDRITQYHDGGASQLRTPHEGPPPRIERQTPPDLRPQILFTGFPAVQRAVLEQRSEAAGLRVVKTVTQGLVFLCAGPNAGPSKVSKARAQGVYVLGEPDLHRLLETGELPDSAIEE